MDAREAMAEEVSRELQVVEISSVLTHEASPAFSRRTPR